MGTKEAGSKGDHVAEGEERSGAVACGGSPGNGGDNEAALQEYLFSKDELAAAVRSLGVEHLRRRRKRTPAGLRNQGATCYLNSLLQHLYHTPEFCAFICTWRYDATAHGPADRSIPRALQCLFARLYKSSSAAVGTEELTKAFGWDRAQTFAQHDISELMRVLFNALGEATRDFGRVEKLYQGVLTSYITALPDTDTDTVTDTDTQCTPQRITRHHREPFLDIQLDVRGHASVSDALKGFFTPEELHGDNRWQLDDGSKVRALKGMALAEAPTLLTLALKRFSFDLHTLRRVKVNNELEVPLELDTAAILASLPAPPPVVNFDEKTPPPAHVNDKVTASPADVCGSVSGGGGGGGGGSGGGVAAGGVYDLEAIFMHSGTATGGHYTAFLFVRDSAEEVEAVGDVDAALGGPGALRGCWYWFNDACVSRVGGGVGEVGVGERVGGAGMWGSVEEMLRQASGKGVSCGEGKEGGGGGVVLLRVEMMIFGTRSLPSLLPPTTIPVPTCWCTGGGGMAAARATWAQREESRIWGCRGTAWRW